MELAKLELENEKVSDVKLLVRNNLELISNILFNIFCERIKNNDENIEKWQNELNNELETKYAEELLNELKQELDDNYYNNTLELYIYEDQYPVCEDLERNNLIINKIGLEYKIEYLEKMMAETI